MANVFFEQTGTANPFNGIDIGQYSAPTLADIDGDGDRDAIVGEYDGFLNYYRNTGTVNAPVYAEQTGTANPFNGIDIGFFSAPTFADLDGDGDLDAIVGENDGNLRYYRNTGTATAPLYAAQTGTANPFNGINVGFNSNPTLADLDGDGDLDAIVGENDGNLNYYRNTGTVTAPVYVAQTGTANPFNGINIGTYSAPTLADLDGDGDLDAIVGESDGFLNYYRNTGTVTAPVYAAQTGTANPFNGIDIGAFSQPTFADLDGDGDLDAIVGKADGFLNYFLSVVPIAITQTGGNTQVTEGGATDSYTVVLGFQPTADVTITLNGGTQLSTNVTTLTFTTANWNVAQTVTVTAINDTIGEGPHRGTITATSSSTDTRFNGLAIAPVPVTITDNDLPTTAPVYAEQTGTANPFNGIDIGISSKPTFADIDGDGDLDAIVGESDGTLNYFLSVVPNFAPTAVSLNNQVTEIAENTSTATRIKVADIAITDDGLGTNNLSVSGTDASFFEVDATGLYIKANTSLDFETKTSYSVTVNVDDSTVGATPDAIATYSLSVTDINENPSVFGFSAATYRVIEDGTTSGAITINRTINTTGTGSVTVNLSGGTATATTDYNNSPITINFADGETSKTVVVPIIFDSINEPVETVNLSLTNPTGAAYGATVSGNTSSVLSIIDFYNRSTSTQNETIVAPSGASVVNASTGTGNDTIDLNLNNRTGNAVVSAGMGNDSIFAGAGNDLLDGGGGDDNIFGGAGADRLLGGAGVDILYGGLGNDRLTGGLGNDIFALEAASGTDLILDFQTGDRFGLTGSLTFDSLSFVASGVNTNITNSGNVLAIVTGVAPSAIGVFVSTNFVPLP